MFLFVCFSWPKVISKKFTLQPMPRQDSWWLASKRTSISVSLLLTLQFLRFSIIIISLFVAKSSSDDSSSAKKTDDSRVTDMKNELYVLKKLNNPYIVKMYCHFVVNNVLYIFIKLANEGNMAKFVEEKVLLIV